MLEQDKAPVKTGENTTSARRGFLKKASIGAPIVIASSTRPAWGATCLSGMMSGNVSDHGAQCELNSGRTPSQWKKQNIGAANSHWINNTKPPQGQKTIDKIKPEFREHFRKYYYIDGQNQIHYSVYRTYNSLLETNDRIGRNLKNGDLFAQQMTAAFINASLQTQIGYDYSPSDVNEIFDAVLSGEAEEQKVAEMLATIHGS